MKQGLLHLYCGDGKGKTTAAVGLAVRAAGAGLHVLFVQFLKGRDSGEVGMLRQLPGIEVLRCDRDYGFTFSMTPEDRAAITRCHDGMLRLVHERMASGETELVVLDEFCAAYRAMLFDIPLAEDLVLHRPAGVEMVLTGRDPAEKFRRAADYLSEIRALAHPYERGIPARRGIEY
ncbi:MAG: cob(I)yrinic acid a,c-diamide adenosyltransferase [Oscillospiraceae bacterium]|nr:cob(I)yrinic acid a,c-diamide adenosyltransferase [Oscillospiraceae bacterium]